MATLVTYASKHGATREIAERIGETLYGQGVDVTVHPVQEVTNLEPYDAVIIGSAVYFGQWRKEAARFVDEHHAELARCKVWLFSSGPTVDGQQAAPLKIAHYAGAIHLRDHHVFGGRLDPKQLSILERLAVVATRSPVGDFRDWDEVQAWAMAIAEQLQKAAAA